MNEARVRRLATEGRVELTRKMFKRLTRMSIRTSALVARISRCEMKDENVFAYPDFACRMGLRTDARDFDMVCVQTGDGRTVRIVGVLDCGGLAALTRKDT
jgi:hypothetical protein